MLSLLAAVALQGTTRTIEVGQAYVEPNPEGIEVERGQPSGPWTNPKDKLVWYAKFRKAGDVELSLKANAPEPKGKLRLRASDRDGLLLKADSQAGPQVSLGRLTVKQPGTVRFELSAIGKLPASFRVIGLQLSGQNVESALINATQWRSAASTHLRWPVPAGTKAVWFYNEILPKKDPLATYYMACGWHRGYFGIQVNSKTERRVIFSVWDSGKEAVDRAKVDEELQVKLMGKGPDVFTGSFGNEGTGGHSHLKYQWKTNQVQRFLVHAVPNGTTTTYSGYYYFPDRKEWGLISYWRAPQDGGTLKSLYSFIEDWWGVEGQKQRLAEFGPAWVLSDSGQWTQVRAGSFTHTARNQPSYREDYYAKVTGHRVAMSSGGYTDEPPTPYNAPFTGVAASGGPGKDVLEFVANTK